MGKEKGDHLRFDSPRKKERNWVLKKEETNNSAKPIVLSIRNKDEQKEGRKKERKEHSWKNIGKSKKTEKKREELLSLAVKKKTEGYIRC